MAHFYAYPVRVQLVGGIVRAALYKILRADVHAAYCAHRISTWRGSGKKRIGGK